MYVVMDEGAGRPVGPFDTAEQGQAWIDQATDRSRDSYAEPEDLRVEEVMAPAAALAGIRGED